MIFFLGHTYTYRQVYSAIKVELFHKCMKKEIIYKIVYKIVNKIVNKIVYKIINEMIDYLRIHT